MIRNSVTRDRKLHFSQKRFTLVSPATAAPTGRLTGRGHDEDKQARIREAIGLKIGAQVPAGIVITLAGTQARCTADWTLTYR